MPVVLTATLRQRKHLVLWSLVARAVLPRSQLSPGLLTCSSQLRTQHAHRVVQQPGVAGPLVPSAKVHAPDQSAAQVTIDVGDGSPSGPLLRISGSSLESPGYLAAIKDAAQENLGLSSVPSVSGRPLQARPRASPGCPDP